jgi:cell wall assembly regulator SMI1
MAGLMDGGDFDDREAEGEGGVKSDWWNKRWVPFLEGGDGNCLCVDMDPDVDGAEGQVIEFWHADNDRSVVAKSLAGFLSSFARDLVDDQYDVSERGGLRK